MAKEQGLALPLCLVRILSPRVQALTGPRPNAIYDKFWSLELLDMSSFCSGVDMVAFNSAPRAPGTVKRTNNDVTICLLYAM